MYEFLKQFSVVAAIFVLIGILSSAYIIREGYVSKKYFTYYTSYLELLNLASGVDDYKEHNSIWPTNLEELFAIRPDLTIDREDSYGSPIIYVPYNKILGYGELISYGKDRKRGGDKLFDRDLEIRFPVDTQSNREWNQRVNEEFTNRIAQGLW
jgi:hypothetical protein